MVIGPGGAWAGVRERVIALPGAGQGARSLTLRRLWGSEVPVPAWLRDALERERAEFDPTLLIPPALSIGILLYFAAPDEPSLGGTLLLTLILAAAAGIAAMRGAFAWIPACLAFVALGFSAATLRTSNIAAPALTKPLSAEVQGIVLSLDRRANGGARVVLRTLSIEGLAPSGTPTRIRLSISDAKAARPGDTVRVKASLRPPSPPAMPGGYDFARDAYFNGIGAVGFSLGAVKPVGEVSPLSL